MAQVTGKVAALQRDQVLLTLDDGDEVMAPLCGALADLAEPGAEVLVYLDEHRRLVGWYLPRFQIGVDLREGKGDT